MNFGLWIIVLSTILYVMAGVVFCIDKHYGLSLAYFCYAGANIGLAMTTKNL